MAVIKVLLLLLGLIAFASAQDNETTTEDMMMPTTMMPTTMAPTMAPTDEAPTNMSESAARYAAQEAMMTRNNHFYVSCVCACVKWSGEVKRRPT